MFGEDEVVFFMREGEKASRCKRGSKEKREQRRGK